jgi:hypothetical protein
MYPTNPQKDLKSGKGNEPFSGTALEMEFSGSIDARRASSELTPYDSRFTVGCALLFPEFHESRVTIYGINGTGSRKIER